MGKTIRIKNAKLIQIGSSYGITVPKSYINHEIINLSKEYDVVFTESIKGDNNSEKSP